MQSDTKARFPIIVSEKPSLEIEKSLKFRNPNRSRDKFSKNIYGIEPTDYSITERHLKE